MSKMTAIGVVVPTLNAGELGRACFAAVAEQSCSVRRRLVIDSASTDTTVAQARDAGFEVMSIARADFNHGGTRQFAAEILADCDIIVFLTQDAVLVNRDALAELVGCFDAPRVALAYGRQLPHKEATPIEAHARIFSYGSETQINDLAAIPRRGAKAFFCSNSFAAYRRSILFELGGFRRDLILGEDAEFAARAIKAGYVSVYCATAQVRHSHNYTISEIFWRYFDTGVFHARNPWMREEFGSYGGEGIRFVLSELQFLAKRAPLQIPRALAQTLAKITGYQLGRREKIIPKRFKPWLSMTPGYWRAR